MMRGLFSQPPVRILITGSRAWRDRRAMMLGLLSAIKPYLAKSQREFVLVHGGADGADRLSEMIWRSMMTEANLPIHVEVHTADWNKYGRRAGGVRNQRMVDRGADLCIAFPLGESPGTRDCMRRAEAAKIEVINYGDAPSKGETDGTG